MMIDYYEDQAYVSISEVHDVREAASFPVRQADTVLEDDVGGLVPGEDGVHLPRPGLGIHLVQLLGSLSQRLDQSEDSINSID